MVLPFEPMTMTFKDLHYWVQIPKVPITLITWAKIAVVYLTV